MGDLRRKTWCTDRIAKCLLGRRLRRWRKTRMSVWKRTSDMKRTWIEPALFSRKRRATIDGTSWQEPRHPGEQPAQGFEARTEELFRLWAELKGDRERYAKDGEEPVTPR